MLIKAGALGEIYEFKKEEELIKNIIKIWPNHWEAYYLYAIKCSAAGDDGKSFEMIDKSIELEENFDNVIIKAQLLQLSGKKDFMEYIAKAKKIDKERTEKFMKNHWVNNIEDVNPTFNEILSVLKMHIKQSLRRKQ